MSTAIRVEWLAGRLRQFLLPLLLIYLLIAGGTYNGSVLFTLQHANFIFFSICGLAWLGWRFWRRRAFPATPLDGPLAAWLAVGLLSGFFSTNPRLSLDAVTASLVYALAFYLVVDLARAGWSREVWLTALLTASLVVLAFGVYEVISWYLRWLAIGGWQDPIPPATMRARATLGHPNIAAAYLNLMLPLGLAFIFRRRKLRWLLLVWAGVALVLIFFTSSRGGWLGTLAALSSLGLLLGIDQRAQVLRAWGWLRARWWALAGLLLAAAAGASVAGMLLLRQAQNPSHAQGDQRAYIWVVAWDMFKAHPLMGNGPGTYGIEFLRRYSIPPGMLLAHAHNFALNTLGEMGALGGLALAGLAVTIVAAVWRGWRDGAAGTRALSAGLIASLVGLAVHSQFDTPETVPVINLLTAVILGLLMERQARPAAALSPRRVSWPLWLGMLAALGLWGYSNSSYAVFSRGLAASYASDWSTTAKLLDETTRREPRLAYGWFEDGFAHGVLALNVDGGLRDAAELQTALAAYERGMALEDGYALNWANLGRLRLAAGDAEGALQAFASAARLADQSAEMQMIYGSTLEQLQHPEQARVAYRAALALQPGLKKSEFFQHSVLRQEVLAGLPAAAPDPQDGWQALDAGDYARAASLFRAQAGLNNALVFLGLGQALTALGDYPAAERALRTAEFAGGDGLDVNEALAALYVRMKAPEKLAQARAAADVLRARSSVFGPGTQGESAYAWYIYHRESLPLDLLPGMGE